MTEAQTQSPPAPTLHRAFHASLCLMLFCLPLTEAPKTVFLLLSMVLGCADAWFTQRRLRIDRDDALLLLWAVSGFVVAAFAGMHDKEWGGAHGPLLLALLLLVVRNANFSRRELLQMAVITIIAVLLGLVEGGWQWYVGTHKALQLRSVGHVNHTSIYISLTFALTLALALTVVENCQKPLKYGLLASLAVVIVALVVCKSRATLLATSVLALSYGLLLLRRAKWPLLAVILGLAVTAGGLHFGEAQVVKKHQQHTAQHGFLGERQAIWNSAMLGWRHYPWFGLGIKNYRNMDAQVQARWLKEEGDIFRPGAYLPYAHAHSLYLGLLAEQGLFGFTITLLVLARVGWWAYKYPPVSDAADIVWSTWLAAIGALLVVLINGVFNTTLHHEHGLLSVTLFGLWGAQCRPQQTAASPVAARTE